MSRLQKRHKAAKEQRTKIAGPAATYKGKYLTLVQNPNNTLSVIPNPQAIAEFVKEHLDHLPTDIVMKLNPEATETELKGRRFNTWGDDEVLKALLKDCIEQGGWDWVLPHTIGALTDAPILKSPDNRTYWHERYQIEAAAEELILGKTVNFDGDDNNRQISAAPIEPVADAVDATKTSSKKTADDAPDTEEPAAETSIVDAPKPLPAPPIAPVSSSNPYDNWQTTSLIETIENLTKQDYFATAKPEQEALGQMAEALSARPVEQEQIEEQNKQAAIKTAGTWLQDLQKSDPELAAAYKVTGNQSNEHLRAMVKALSMGGINTPEEEKRKAAAKYILSKSRKRASGDLDEFTKAYITAALWSSNDESDEQGGEPLDANYGIEDIAPRTLEGMKKDCAQFQAENADMIQDNISGAGHDFWLTRNGHGAGFWDGDWPENGDALTAAAKKFGEVDLYIGDDGLIYSSGDHATKAAAFGVPPTNQDTSKILEGDKSVPDGRDKVEDNTGITIPATDLPSKFAGTKKADGNAVMTNDGELDVIEGDKDVADNGTGEEDNTGIVVPSVDTPSKFASYRVQVVSPKGVLKSATFGRPSEAHSIFETHRRDFVGQTGIRVHLAGIEGAGWKIIKSGNVKVAASPEALAKADQAIEAGHPLAYDLAADQGLIFSNVKHWSAFREQVADEIELLGANFNPNETDSEPFPIEDTDDFRMDFDGEFADNFPDHTAGLNLAGKTASADISAARAVKLCEDVADKLKALYLEAKPIAKVNDTRAVREAVESIYGAMKMIGEAQKVLAKQERLEAEEEAAMAALVKAKKKSSLMANLKIAASEEDEDEQDDAPEPETKEASKTVETRAAFRARLASVPTKLSVEASSELSHAIIRVANAYRTATRRVVTCPSADTDFFMNKSAKLHDRVSALAKQLGVTASFKATANGDVEVKLAFEDGTEEAVPTF